MIPAMTCCQFIRLCTDGLGRWRWWTKTVDLGYYANLIRIARYDLRRESRSVILLLRGFAVSWFVVTGESDILPPRALRTLMDLYLVD